MRFSRSIAPRKPSLLAALLITIVLSWSQNGEDARWIAPYKKAEAAYDRATAMASQSGYDEAAEEALNQEALENYRLALHLLSAGGRDSVKYRAAFRAGELHHYFERIDSALAYYRQAITIQRASTLPDSLLFKPLLYTGLIEYRRNRFDTALVLFNQAEAVERKWHPRPLQESERLWNLQGVLHYEKGDYRQAEHYFRTALEKLDPAHPYYLDLYVNYQINLAQIQLQLEEYSEANSILTGLLPRVKGLNASLVNQNLGLINHHLGASRAALNFYRDVHFTDHRRVWLYNNIGEAHLQLRQIDSARNYFDLALTTYRELERAVDQKALGQTLKNLGDLEALNDPLRALRYYQEALGYFYPAFRDTAIAANPERFSGVFSYINLFKTLVAKAEALQKLYEQGEGERWGRQALASWRSAFDLTRYVERTYNSDESRLFLGQIKYLVHGRPIDLAYQLYRATGQNAYLEELYRYDQLNKASVLAYRQGLEQNGHEEGDLRTRITRLSLQAVGLRDSNAIAGISAQIRAAERQLEQEEKKRDQGTDVPAMASLQSLLDGRTAIISFHLSDSLLTRLVITRETISAVQKRLPKQFGEELERYGQHLRSGAEADGRPWYRLLLDSLPAQAERLILIPDDELHFLSFESLVDPEGRFLVEKKSVQYQYSTLLLQHDGQALKGHHTLALAPFAGGASSDPRFPALPHSEAEVKGLDGKVLLNEQAGRDSFIAALPRYDVLHLATHAVAGARGQSSYIAFADAKGNKPALMDAEAIGNLDLQKTKLVVLSACETGSGELVRGEGLMSLSRAFAYAGCNNIITSLWKANDYSTSYLTQKFHRYLDEGLSIDAALRKAKLDYLADKTVNPRLKHPYYWSHLVFVGNYRPDEGGMNFVWWIVGGGLLVLLGWTFRKYR